MPEESRTCIYCHNEYEVEEKWPFVTCQECAKKLDSELNDILFGDILDYGDEDIISFLPTFPNYPFKLAYSSVMRGHHISAEPVAKDILVQKFREIATDIKNTLITNGIAPEKRKCESCGHSYDANAIWPYTICKECAGKKYWEHRDFWVTDALGLGEEYVAVHPLVPPMDVSKYRLRKITKIMPEDAQRIQSHADRTGTNQDFKARAQSAAAKNVEDSSEC